MKPLVLIVLHSTVLPSVVTTTTTYANRFQCKENEFFLKHPLFAGKNWLQVAPIWSQFFPAKSGCFSLTLTHTGCKIMVVVLSWAS